ncbi:MAG: hypothetical protein ACHP8A_14140 [Terriglobales bacterium]|jgi:hypothetical protein
MTDNWVDRKRKREENLKGAWNTIRGAIRTNLANLESLHSGIEVTCLPDSPDSLTVVAVPKNAPYPPGSQVTVQREGTNSLGVIYRHLQKEKKEKENFSIDADESEVFLKTGGQRISLDDFSERVLKPVFPD